MKVEEGEKEVRPTDSPSKGVSSCLALLLLPPMGKQQGVFGWGVGAGSFLGPIARVKAGKVGGADYPKPISGLGNKNRERGKKRRAWPWKSFFKTSVCNSRRKKKQR